jgi:hypothetical protein
MLVMLSGNPCQSGSTRGRQAAMLACMSVSVCRRSSACYEKVWARETEREREREDEKRNITHKCLSVFTKEFPSTVSRSIADCYAKKESNLTSELCCYTCYLSLSSLATHISL